MGVRSSAFIITTCIWPRGGDGARPGLKLWRQNHTTPRVLLLGSSLKRSKENNIDIHSAVHNQMNVHFTDETLAVRWAKVWNMSAHPAAFEGLRSAESLSKHEWLHHEVMLTIKARRLSFKMSFHQAEMEMTYLKKKKDFVSLIKAKITYHELLWHQTTDLNLWILVVVCHHLDLYSTLLFASVHTSSCHQRWLMSHIMKFGRETHPTTPYAHTHTHTHARAHTHTHTL